MAGCSHKRSPICCYWSQAKIHISTIAFLSQQVAEKCLKALLVFYDIEPLRTHDLTNLLDACAKIKPELEELRDACETVTGFYIEVRYPPDIPDYTRLEIQESFDCATKIKDKVLPLIAE